jgi:hypothetical protein
VLPADLPGRLPGPQIRHNADQGYTTLYSQIRGRTQEMIDPDSRGLGALSSCVKVLLPRCPNMGAGLHSGISECHS